MAKRVSKIDRTQDVITDNIDSATTDDSCIDSLLIAMMDRLDEIHGDIGELYYEVDNLKKLNSEQPKGK